MSKTVFNASNIERWFYNGQEISEAYLNNILVFQSGDVIIEYWTTDENNKKQMNCKVENFKEKIAILNSRNTNLNINIILKKQEIFNMKNCFCNCGNIKNIDLSNIVATNSYYNWESTFYNCQNLVNINGLENIRDLNSISLSNLFSHCIRLNDIDLSNWNTSNVTNMAGMFAYVNFENIGDIGNWNTSNVTNMAGMFNDVSNVLIENCKNIFSKWKTNNVVNMSNMFYWSYIKNDIDIKAWNLSNVRDMSGMFLYCYMNNFTHTIPFNITNCENLNSMFHSCSKLIKGINFNNISMTKSVKDIGNMYYQCSNLRTINFVGLNKTLIENTSHLFCSCDNLTIIPISTWFNNMSNCKNMSGMFELCYNLSSAFNLSTLNISKVENMSEMFLYCNNLNNIGTINNWNLINCKNMYSTFYECSNLSSIGDISNWNISNIENMESIFGYCSNLIGSWNLYNWNINDKMDILTMFWECPKITSIGNIGSWNTSNIKWIPSLFRNCQNLTTIGNLNNWDTSKMNSFNFAFQNCFNLITIGDLSNWNTNNLIGLYSTFQNCSKIKTLGDLSNWEVSNVDTLSNTFYNCQNLTTIGNLFNWNTSNVKDMNRTFYMCTNLSGLDLSNWDVSNVINMTNTFYGYSGPTIGNLSNWNTSNITNMFGMFRFCEQLSVLDIKNWDIKNVTDGRYLFCGMLNLTNLDLSNWEVNSSLKTIAMFNNCRKLEDLKLPVDLPSIGSNCFRNCINLLYYDFSNYSFIPSLVATDGFYNINTNAKIVVPEILYNDWKEATNWVTYKDYIIPKWNEITEYLRMGASIINGPERDEPLSWDQTEVEVRVQVYGNTKDMNGNIYNNIVVKEWTTKETIEKNETQDFKYYEFNYSDETSGLTFTLNVVQDYYRPYDITIGTWQIMSAIANPDETLYNGYQSAAIGHSATSTMTLTVKNGVSNFIFYLWGYWENSCDWTWASELDEPTVEKYRAKFISRTDTNPLPIEEKWVKCEYTNIPAGEHTITITYHKDISNTYGLDKGFILIPKNQ